MGEDVCDQCGSRNAYATVFCASCGAFLAWDTEHPPDRAPAPVASSTRTASSSGGSAPAPDQEGVTTVLRPAPAAVQPVATSSTRTDAAPVPRSSGGSVPPDSTEGVFQAVVEQLEVTVPVSGAAVPFVVRVTNTSDIVDGYVLTAVAAPDWLLAESTEVRLLPGTSEPVTARLRVAPGVLVPAQQVRLVLRLHSVSRPSAHLDVSALVIVPVQDAPVLLRAEPRLLRVRDGDTARCAVVVDNSRSNRAVQVRLSGTDPELAVRFDFDPAVLKVGPGQSASSRLAVTAAGPEPGQQVVRPLTIVAADGNRVAEAPLMWEQSTSVRTEDPLVSLEVEPALLRVRDTRVGTARLVVDNRGAQEWAHLHLAAADPERLVRVTWAQPLLHVPPGQRVQTEVRFEAPLPDAGSEVSRTVSVTAADGRRTATATMSFTQVASPSPMTTLVVRVDPGVVRVFDADAATVQVVLDNRRGQAGVRLGLEGRDPERAVGFTFMPPVVDVGPGQIQAVGLRLDSARPGPGQELTRSFTVTASDGRVGVDGSGTLVQTASRAAIELLSLRLDPSVVRLANRGRGTLSAVIDNRGGAQPVGLAMSGDDPENVVRFAFTPAVLDVPAGGMATVAVRVRAPKPPSGREVARPFLIAASDGRSVVQSEGSLIQSAADRRPVARALFTLVGALTMIVGVFLPWVEDARGIDLNAPAFGVQLDRLMPQVVPLVELVSLGLVIAGLGVLVLFGLTGRSGRLTRFAAGLGALLMLALFAVVILFGGNLDLHGGAALVLLGCIAGYIGGRLVPR